ncbi:hypothetical protein SLS62_004647 [Diatrype stigma]|uniref:F-box domain-containing protein n=1 Tax=Diatrype stigma TaxID=117547 RepID=A0AAN9UU89_9PEZI
MGTSKLLSLPRDILVLLPSFLHNIEDFVNVSSTCRTLRECMGTATPHTILHLAAAQSRVFFRPSPHFLVAATARELGNWARQSDANEAELVYRLRDGVDGLLDLALTTARCGLATARIRELHGLRFSIINPTTDLIDKCVGEQWYQTPNFWGGGVDDAYTIDSDPPEAFFHLAIYGELFAPDLDALLRQDHGARRLKVDTRLEYVKYCIPDWATHAGTEDLYGRPVDPRRSVQPTGPYAAGNDGPFYRNNNIALTWVIRSSRWRPHWKRVREQTGLPDFKEEFDDGWWYDAAKEERLKQEQAQDWRQRLWENVMVCQGLEGLGMIQAEHQGRWVPRVREWREQIARLEEEPPRTMVGKQATLEYPYLLGDLRICVSGYVSGT